MKTALRAAVIAAIGLAFQMIVTQAYSTFGKWPPGPVLYYFNPLNNDVSEAAAEAALLAGLTAWNNQGGALFQFMYGGRVSDTTLSNDGRNVVFFRNEASGNAIATTYTWRIGSTIIDADIVFWDGAFKFITEGDACSHAAYIEDIATHEFGHGLGLGHSTDPASTMWPTYFWCSREARTLAPDDIAGIQSLYGVDGSANTAPVVAISSPASGGLFSVSGGITFTASASDAQDGSLSSALQWASNIDGVIGSGPSFTRTLSIGVHTITASVSDSGGLSGSASVTITVASNPLGGTGSASFVGVDTQTRGNWQGVYGAHGYQLANDGAALPANVSINRIGANAWTWAASTSDSRALQQVASLDRIAATWFGNFDTRLTFNDTVKHRVAIYVLDWDHRGRSQTIQILHSSSLAVLDQRTVSAFESGRYLVWEVQGGVTIRIVSDAGPNAVYSALFIDPVSTTPPPSSAATFVATDLGTQGTWKSSYGAHGYSLANDGTSVPS